MLSRITLLNMKLVGRTLIHGPTAHKGGDEGFSNIGVTSSDIWPCIVDTICISAASLHLLHALNQGIQQGESLSRFLAGN